jgi:NitT/TauT family transport system ATP-binding protein
VIRLEGVTKRFPIPRGSITAVDRLDLHVEPGEFVSVIGPSGCGKSTVLRMTAGLTPSDEGSVLVGGRKPDAARRGKRVALAPQRPALLPWMTVRANARLLTRVNRRQGTPLDARSIDGLLDEVGLTDFASAYPWQLSGGMQQRASLVRAFATGAPVLLMDEPFAALDELTRSDMRYLLTRVWERHQATVLFVTHSVAEAVMLSDRVVVMSPRPGRVEHEEPIGLPRPRRPEQEDGPQFAAHVAAIRASLATRHH